VTLYRAGLTIAAICPIVSKRRSAVGAVILATVPHAERSALRLVRKRTRGRSRSGPKRTVFETSREGRLLNIRLNKVAVPRWVPQALANDYRERALLFDEFAAASMVRGLLNDERLMARC
jgi:hypothetical protein